MRLAGYGLLLIIVFSVGCDESGPPAIATFDVNGESFRVRLTTVEQVAAARAARDGTGPKIPNGRIANGTDVNEGWSWHLVDLAFAEQTVELCDGRPSDVEASGGEGFADGTYCPWSASVVSIEPAAPR